MSNKPIILGEGCEWIIEGINKSFGSEAALDKYIQDELKKGTYSIEKGKLRIIQSVDPMARAKKILEDIKAEISGVAEWVTPDKVSSSNSLFNANAEEVEGYYRIVNSIGVNRFLQAFNKPGEDEKFVEPFNKEAWRQACLKELTHPEDPKKVPMSEDAAKELIKKIEDTWPQLSGIGTEIHGIFESVFKGEVPVWKSGMWLNQELFDSTVQQINKLKSDILQQYPDAEFYTEFGIMTKDLTPEMKDAMGDKYDSINGKIDLLVIDKQGNAHIYDFKVSRKSIGKWTNRDAAVRKQNEQWDIGKLDAAAYQLAFYAAMLKQKGITVRDANIVPVKLDLSYENEEYKQGVKSINGVTIDPTKDHLPDILSGKYGNAANQTITQEFKTTSQDILDMVKTFNFFFPKNTTLQRIEEIRANVDHYKNNERYVQRLRPGDPYYSDYKYRLKQIGIPGNPSKLIKNEEELDSALEDFVRKLNSSKTDFCVDFGHLLQDVFSGNADISKLADKAPNSQNLRNFFAVFFILSFILVGLLCSIMHEYPL